MADVAILSPEVASAPQDYTLPGAQEIFLRAVGCTIDGTSASGAFLPALQMLDPTGRVMWTAVNPSIPVAAGRSALVSWFPGGGIDRPAQTSDDTGGTISEIVSPLGTISVAFPNGPTTDLDLPASGATAGTYGDATHTSQVTVNAEGIVTAAAQVGISGIAGTGLVKLFDSTLGSAAASIDTGANAIPTGHGDLIVMCITQTADAAAAANALIRVNGDTGAHYDAQRVQGVSATTSAGVVLAGTNWPFQTHGGGGTSGYPGVLTLFLPSYDQTTFNKIGVMLGSTNDATAGNNQAILVTVGWRSTAAINQLAVVGSTANLVTGSRMVIYGCQ